METGPGRITLWAIEIFVATADEGSISAAARRLGTSASTVSQQLTNLEAAVGTSLLRRNARPLTLTPAGAIFRRRAKAIIAEAELARAEIARGDLSALTSFRLGVIEDFEADVTPGLLTRMSDRLQDCHFQLETGPSHLLSERLEERALDVIVASEVGDPPDWAEVHPLLTEGFVAAAKKGTVDPSADLARQLRQMPLVQYTKRHHMGRMIDDHLARHRFRHSQRFELDSYHAILALVAQGAGWTILTPLALQRARRFAPELDVFRLPIPPLSRTISLMARQDTLGALPAEVAGHLRDLLRGVIIEPATAQRPWLHDVLTLLE